ncbi:MAG: hypothetical protein RR928_16310 [Comamonas sp.]|uniref:hypothetical protein n=1 Tax=Comamonas sp. TaxID=34028 RepID=UPI002FC933AE
MNTPPAIRWMALLILEGPCLEPGISTSFYERLPGSFHTADEAMDVAQDAADKHPDAIGCSAKRMEVPHGL